MRSPRLTTATLVAVLLGSAWSAGQAHQNVGISTHADETVRRCSDLTIKFDDEPALTDEEMLTAPAGADSVLTVRPPTNGGIYVTGAARRDFSITACKAVAPGRNGGRALLDRIHASVQNGTVSASGLANDYSVVYFIIEAPVGAELDLSAHNGPIAVREFSGRGTVHTENGPVSLLNVSGQVAAYAQNGPIRFEGGSGKIELETQNGPIGIRLAGERWGEGGLSARAQNGPLQLDVPSGFRSGVRVESSQHSPWSCDGAACGDGRKSWDDHSRSLELGQGPIMVRVSTVNGPVQVRAAR
jgi:hypothetical protein